MGYSNKNACISYQNVSGRGLQNIYLPYKTLNKHYMDSASL